MKDSKGLLDSFFMPLSPRDRMMKEPWAGKQEILPVSASTWTNNLVYANLCE